MIYDDIYINLLVEHKYGDIHFPQSSLLTIISPYWKFRYGGTLKLNHVLLNNSGQLNIEMIFIELTFQTEESRFVRE